jgi:hypothetical protein
MKRDIALVGSLCITLHLVSFAHAQSVTIVNPSFEENSIGSSTITGWTSSDSANTTIVSAPALTVNSSPLMDNNQAAQLSNTGTAVTLSQVITGLSTTASYFLEYAQNTSSATAQLYGDIFYPVGPVFAGSGYVSGTFTPFSPTVTLTFAAVTPDSSVQFDAVSLHELKPNEVPNALFNATFQGSQSTAANDTSSQIAGWQSVGVTGIAPNISGQLGPADNGKIPDGNVVAFLTASSAELSSLDQELNPGFLTVGQSYLLSFYYNASSVTGSDPASMTVTAGSTTLANDVTVDPVGGSNAYHFFSEVFTYTPSAQIDISNSDFGPDGQSTLLLDDVTIQSVVPEPASASLLALLGVGLIGRRRFRR